jgi:anaerobic selenocysteine-containing dehydrogenase
MSDMKKGICPFCRLGCELGILADDWSIRGVEYLKGSGLNDGSLCARGNGAALYLDHPKRLTFPLHNGNEIRWKEAFAELADILRRTDSRELAITYDSNLTEDEYSLLWGFAEKLGVGNLACSYLEPEFYFNNAMPEVPRATLDEIRKNSVFLIVGDLFNQTPVIARHILEAKYATKNGRMYVIDSYVTNTASFADTFLQVNPGTESLALLALSSLVSQNRTQYPVETYAVSSGLELPALKDVANSLLSDERKAVIAVMALGRTEDPVLLSGSAQHLTRSLPGDRSFLPLGESFGRPGKVEFTDVLDKIESGKIKVLINFGEIFPYMYPQFLEKLRTLSHFVCTAVLKTHVNVPGLWLPASLNLEKSGILNTAFGERKISPIVSPYSGAKSAGEIVEKLAAELSLSLDGGEASTSARTVESGTLKSRADRLLEQKRNGFHLLGEKLAYHFRSLFGEKPYLKLNPVDANQIGVKSGQQARAKTSQAETDLKVVATERVPRGLAVVPVEFPEVRTLFEPSVEEGVLSFRPQTVELRSQESLGKEKE